MAEAEESASEPTESTERPVADSLTESAEDALRHIYSLEHGGDGWVSNTSLAERLGVTRPTVTSTFERLADDGLIEREKYRPVRLTPAGERAALRMVRRHRLLESYLAAEFDYELDEVDAEADVLEHHVSDRFCRALERALDFPQSDPHGDPIPDATLAVRPDTGSPLSEIPVGRAVDVTRLRVQDDETLGYLLGVDIEPAARLVVEARAPFGLVTVRVSGAAAQQSLPETVASRVLVQPVDGEPAESGLGQ